MASDQADICEFRLCAMNINLTKSLVGIFPKHEKNKKGSILSKAFSI